MTITSIKRVKILLRIQYREMKHEAKQQTQWAPSATRGISVVQKEAGGELCKIFMKALILLSAVCRHCRHSGRIN